MNDYESQCFVLFGAFAVLLHLAIIWWLLSWFNNKRITATRYARILCYIVVTFIFFHFFSSMSNLARKEIYEGIKMPFEYLTPDKLNSNSSVDSMNVLTSIIILLLFYFTPTLVLINEITYHFKKARISALKKGDSNS